MATWNIGDAVRGTGLAGAMAHARQHLSPTAKVQDLASAVNADATGIVTYLGGNTGFQQGVLGSVSIADQAISAATLTLLQGSLVDIPSNGLQTGATLRWTAVLEKSAAGTAASTFFLRMGLAGTVADAAIATFSTGLGTAAADTCMVIIDLVIRTAVGVGSTALASLTLTHNLATTGWIVVPCLTMIGTMATFDSSLAGQHLHLSLTSGASVVPTVRSCRVECLHTGNGAF